MQRIAGHGRRGQDAIPAGLPQEARAAWAPSASRRLFITALTILASCSGCHLPEWAHNGFKVGPNYKPPAAPVASQWIDYRDPRVKSVEPNIDAWWLVFNDPVLNRLIQTSYQQNLTVRAAGQRVMAARAQRGIAVGNLFPQVQEGFGDYTRNKTSTQVANPLPTPYFSNWETGLAASWELDFWGRFRRSIEAADAELDSSVEDYDDVLVILLSDVANTYVEERTFEQRLLFAHQNVDIQRRSFDLAQDKFNHGATTERDVQQSRQILEQTLALIPQLERGQRLARNRLCVLLGIPPQNLDALLGMNGDIPRVPPQVAVGIPADLLRRRPDVRRAERQVAAQSARIGVAVSDLYPHLSINGTIGIAAEDFSDLGKTPGSMFGSVGPSFRWDILNYGRLANNIALQDARFQELAYNYQEQVLTAGREAEDALISLLRSEEQADRLAASVEAAARTVTITEEQYRQGAVDFTAVFLFESVLTQQQDDLARARGDVTQSLVALYRALGGGWQIRLAQSGPLPGGIPAPVPAPAAVPAPELLGPPPIPALGR